MRHADSPSRALTDSAASKGEAAIYESLLSDFGANARRPAECVAFLVAKGFRVGQARSAVYRYRSRHGLIDKLGAERRDDLPLRD